MRNICKERFHTIATQNDTKFFYFSVNITDAAHLARVMDEAVAAIRSPLRGVVTAAGISGDIDALEYKPEDFRRVLDINIMGTFLVVQSAVRVMQKQKMAGSVVLIASMSGHIANKVPF